MLLKKTEELWLLFLAFLSLLGSGYEQCGSDTHSCHKVWFLVILIHRPRTIGPSYEKLEFQSCEPKLNVISSSVDSLRKEKADRCQELPEISYRSHFLFYNFTLYKFPSHQQVPQLHGRICSHQHWLPFTAKPLREVSHFLASWGLPENIIKRQMVSLKLLVPSLIGQGNSCIWASFSINHITFKLQQHICGSLNRYDAPP